MTKQQKFILVRRLLLIVAILLGTSFYFGYHFGKNLKPARHKKVDIIYLVTTWAEKDLPCLYVQRRYKDDRPNALYMVQSPMVQWSNPIALEDDEDYISCYVLEGPKRVKSESGSPRYQYRLMVQMYNDNDDIILIESSTAGVSTVARSRVTMPEAAVYEPEDKK